jgi:hypothetical protein
MTDENLDEESLRRLQTATAKLPREIAPPAEAWFAIRAEIESAKSPAVARRSGNPAYWQRPAFLAAAALVLVAGSSIATAVALGRRAVTPTQTVASQNPPEQESNPAPRASGAPATLAEFTVVENDYISTTNRLSAILESKDTELSPETIAKLKESLRIIDAAILEARRALAEDPANKQLIEMLSTSYNQKVDLLKRTTEMGRS